MALIEGHIELLSQMMTDSHLSLQHDYDVSCYELNLLRDEARSVAQTMGQKRDINTPAIIGGRMTGGGFGGSVVQFIHKDIVDDFMSHFQSGANGYSEKTAIIPTILLTAPCNGLSLKVH